MLGRIDIEFFYMLCLFGLAMAVFEMQMDFEKHEKPRHVIKGKKTDDGFS